MITRLLVDEEGISSVEYAILLAFIAVGLIAAVTVLKDNVVAAFTAASDALLP